MAYRGTYKQMVLRILVALLASSTLVLQGCSAVGDQRLEESAYLIKTDPEAITKIDVFDSLGVPWDVIQNSENTHVGWIYLYLEHAVHPLTYVPYIGLLAGGGDITTYTRFFCFDQQEQLVGRVLGKDEYYTNMWRSASELFDVDEVSERKARRMSEMLTIGVETDGNASLETAEIRWIGEDAWTEFKATLFLKCRDYGLQESDVFEELM